MFVVVSVQQARATLAGIIVCDQRKSIDVGFKPCAVL
jgi:hypothetical protein